MSAELVAIIKDKEEKIEVLRIRAKGLFDDNESRFMISLGVRTPEIDENYKKIDSTFNAKAKLEGEVRSLKKELLEKVLSQ